MKSKIDKRLDVLEQKIDFNNIETALITLLIGGIAILIAIYQPIIESKNIFYIGFLILSVITLPLSLILEIWSFFDETHSNLFKSVSILCSVYLILSVLVLFLIDISTKILSSVGMNDYLVLINYLISIIYVIIFIIFVIPHVKRHLKKKFPLIFKGW